MSSLPTMPVGVDRHLADTAHMSNEEAGAYFRLQIFAWRSPTCALPDDDVRLARMLGTSQKRWARIKATVMATWTLQDGAWTNEQVSRERQFVVEKIEKKRSAGRQGGRPKSLPDNDQGKASGSENRKQNESEPKAAKAKAKESPKAPEGAGDGYSAEFERWLETYPKRDGAFAKPTAARRYAAARKAGATEADLDRAKRAYAVEQSRLGKIGTQFVKRPEFFLSPDFWTGYLAQADPSPRDPAAPDPYLAGLSDEQWRQQLRQWQSGRGDWTLRNRTPPPDHPLTKVPRHILSEFGLASVDRAIEDLLTGTG